MKLRGYTYHISKYGEAVFYDQPNLIYPKLMMCGFTLQTNDTVFFYKNGIEWQWKNNKFVIAAGSTTP